MAYEVKPLFVDKHLGQLLHNSSGQLECPVFKKLLDWIGEKTGVLAF